MTGITNRVKLDLSPKNWIKSIVSLGHAEAEMASALN